MADIRIEVTNSGMGLIAKSLQGIAPVKLTRIQIGNGGAPDDIYAVTELQNVVLDLPITEFERGGNYATVRTMFMNEDVTSSFSLTEVGVIAEDDDGSTVLFGYVYQGDQSEIVLAANSKKILENRIAVQFIVDNRATVTAITSSNVWATKDALDAHIQDKNNPHEVTAEQIGLGKAENVAIQDGTINFEIAKADQLPESGQTLKVIIGKAVKLLDTLIRHIQRKDNPHGVTVAQVGAAPAVHSHAATDIKSGILGVVRGGTGVGTWTQNRLIFARTASALGQIAQPSEEAVLTQKASGAPYYTLLKNIEMVHIGTTAPARTNILWVDTTAVTGGLKYYDTGKKAWVGVPVRYTAN